MLYVTTRSTEPPLLWHPNIRLPKWSIFIQHASIIEMLKIDSYADHNEIIHSLEMHKKIST